MKRKLIKIMLKLIKLMLLVMVILAAYIAGVATYQALGSAWDSSAANEAAKIERHKIGLKYGN